MGAWSLNGGRDPNHLDWYPTIFGGNLEYLHGVRIQTGGGCCHRLGLSGARWPGLVVAGIEWMLIRG